MYSQGQEEKHIVDFFQNKTGRLLDIGANDGKTFSNSLRLIELGWSGVLVEPSPACCEKIMRLHENTPTKIQLVKCAIGNKTEQTTFHESGQLNDPALKGAENISLVSTLVPDEKKRWEALKMDWNEYPVQVFNWPDFLNSIGFKIGADSFDFITIDAEGMDFEIFRQINLYETNTALVCIEYNENVEMKNAILRHAAVYGFTKIIYTSGENILICKQ